VGSELTTHALSTGLQQLEVMVAASSGKYCVGDSLSVADICLPSIVGGTGPLNPDDQCRQQGSQSASPATDEPAALLAVLVLQRAQADNLAVPVVGPDLSSGRLLRFVRQSWRPS